MDWEDGRISKEGKTINFFFFFTKGWKPLMDFFFGEYGKSEMVISGFDHWGEKKIE